MEKICAIPAPKQDDSRIVVLGVVLWPDHIAVHAVGESDAEELANGLQEDEQLDMFQVTYDPPSAAPTPPKERAGPPNFTFRNTT